MLFTKFHAGTRKSVSDFWLSLLEQPTKFVLNVLKFLESCTLKILTLVVGHLYPAGHSVQTVCIPKLYCPDEQG